MQKTKTEKKLEKQLSEIFDARSDALDRLDMVDSEELHEKCCNFIRDHFDDLSFETVFTSVVLMGFEPYLMSSGMYMYAVSDAEYDEEDEKANRDLTWFGTPKEALRFYFDRLLAPINPQSADAQ